MGYADPLLGRLSDLTFALLLSRAGVRWKYTELDGACEIVWPPICGVHLIHVERSQTPGEKMFALRHGFAHVLARHVGDLSFAREGHDWRCFEETVADGFALIDLVADRDLRTRLQDGWTWRDVQGWIGLQLRHYAPRWRPERALARLEFRLLMFAEREGQRAEACR